MNGKLFWKKINKKVIFEQKKIKQCGIDVKVVRTMKYIDS